MKHLFYSLISLIIAIFFIVVGIICVVIPWSVEVRITLVQFILEDSLIISLFGIAGVFVGLAIVANIILNSRRRYYYIRSKDQQVAVDEALIQQYLSIYWKQLFPDYDVPSRITLKKNRIHINVDLPYLPISEQRSLLEKIKEDLNSLFSKSLGYQEEFFLSASFQTKPNTEAKAD